MFAFDSVIVIVFPFGSKVSEAIIGVDLLGVAINALENQMFLHIME